MGKQPEKIAIGDEITSRPATAFKTSATSYSNKYDTIRK
jgi:hypothetical protein